MKKIVTDFIRNFLCDGLAPKEQEVIRKRFRSGYCFHFAHMLKAEFNRGEVCWAVPFGHMVWVDDDGTPYDIEGEYTGDAEMFIPEEYLGDALDDFRKSKGFNATADDLENIKKIYKKYGKK